MNTKSLYTEKTGVDQDSAARAGQNPPVQIRTATGKHLHRARWTATAVAAAVTGVGLTALVIGVATDTDTEAPPSPGIAPFVHPDARPKRK